MQNKDLETLLEIKKNLNSEEVEQRIEDAIIPSPAAEVESSLVGFLKHRLSKLQDVASFEENVRDAILCRLSEATFPQLVSLMDIIQRNNNVATEKVLAPFITQNGNRSVTETLRQSGDSPEEEVYQSTDSKQVLQGLSALSQILGIVNSSQEEDETDDNTSE